MMNADWTEQVKCMGRTHVHNGKLWLAFSGSGIAFQVTGTRCVIRLQGDSTSEAPTPDTHTARYAVYVDGVRTAAAMMDEPERTVTVFAGTEARTACVMLVKLSESAMSTLAVTGIDTDGTISPLPARRHLVEFVGDSITCGYGVDTDAPEQLFHTNNEDVTKAYAWQAADLLDVDRTMVSLSGWGIISGWTADPAVRHPEQLIPDVYEKTGFSYALSDGVSVQDWPWDFSGREPDVVVINLGTNDSSYTVDDAEKRAFFTERYADFLEVIRRCNPHAQILCVLGVMGDELYGCVEQAAAAYTAKTGDTRVETMHLEAIRPDTEGYVSDYHPTLTTHTRVASALAERLGKFLD